MGRTEKSQGLAPPSIRKDQRAKQARHIVNQVIPAILSSNSRARRGVEGSELIVDPGPVVPGTSDLVEEEKGQTAGEDATYIKRKGQGRRKIKDRDDGTVREGKTNGKKSSKRRSLEEGIASLSVTPIASTEKHRKRKIRIINTDTLSAAHVLAFPTLYPGNTETKPTHSNKKKAQNTCILNMASPLRPGGGVLSGATSQEEFLCARTTLLPSLKEEFYRLPEIGGIYTHDVFVFRDASALDAREGKLGPGERWWVDVVSAGMLRFPELEGGRLREKDRRIVERKMRGVMRIASMKGVKKIVLGAWGCGAYGNPVMDIAAAWRSVLDESKEWDGMEEIVFAISNRKMANEFAQEFGGVEVESGPGGNGEEEDDEEGDSVAEELRTKIREMEGQVAQVWNPDLKTRMGAILDGLRAQLTERGKSGGSSTDEDDDEEEAHDLDGDSSGEVEGDVDEEEIENSEGESPG